MKEMNKNVKINYNPQTCVRFSDREYRQIQIDSAKQSKSIPSLLKDNYFSTAPKKVLMNETDLSIIRKDLNKIGNNFNQVAKKLNSGFMHGWNDTLLKVERLLDLLTKQLHYGYGIHKS